MRPLTFLLIGVLGFVVLGIGVGIQSFPLTSYGSLGIGIMLGAFAPSKDN